MGGECHHSTPRSITPVTRCLRHQVTVTAYEVLHLHHRIQLRNRSARVSALPGVYRMMGQLLYGAGLRLLEMLRLRVKDVDFGNGLVIVRHGKGGKDRRTMLPNRLKPELHGHLERVKLTHERDLAEGFGRVALPFALAQRAKPPGQTRSEEHTSELQSRLHLVCR